jgi:hypothetical protein
MKITYGLSENVIDVTQICLDVLKYDNVIKIPDGDYNRASFFTDPLFGTVKKYTYSTTNVGANMMIR